MTVYIKPKIDSDEQILAALRSTGAGFEALGGPSLMLTEAVENGIDSIIESGKLGYPIKDGVIELIIDRNHNIVTIIDNGYGFKNPRHIAEKPFDSLKKYDPELTGQFARGIQGFRQYCNKLTFITRRPLIPNGEEFNGKRGQTIRLEFISDRTDVGCDVISDIEFTKKTRYKTGAAAIYSDWTKGSFDKIKKEDIIKRLEHHFGEEIRKGKIKIFIYDQTGGEKNWQLIKQITPKDYSTFQKIDISPVPYNNKNGTKGEIIFELYLTSKALRNKWTLPFLMYKNRPVGDQRIYDLDEFEDCDVWESNYLTGYIQCDFCQINELRLALKTGPEADFLYDKLHRLEDFLRDQIKNHHKGLVEIKRQKEINELVNKLQSFIKSKNIFAFKLARGYGNLTTDNVLESDDIGIDDTTKGIDDEGILSKEINVSYVNNINPDIPGEGFSHQSEIGGVGAGGSKEKYGGPDEPSAIGIGNDKGYRKDPNGLKKFYNEPTGLNRRDRKDKRKVKTRRPRGYNLEQDEDEYTDELSWFDPATSAIIINTAHKRHKNRERSGGKDLLDYYAELYIWEICKLAKQGTSNEELMKTFLDLKFEYFEEKRNE